MSAEHPVEVAVVDLGLPEDLEGLVLIRHLKLFYPQCKILAITERYSDTEGVAALRAGADDFLGTKWAYLNFYELLFRRLSCWHDCVRADIDPEPATA